MRQLSRESELRLLKGKHKGQVYLGLRNTDKDLRAVSEDVRTYCGLSTVFVIQSYFQPKYDTPEGKDLAIPQPHNGQLHLPCNTVLSLYGGQVCGVRHPVDPVLTQAMVAFCQGSDISCISLRKCKQLCTHMCLHYLQVIGYLPCTCFFKFFFILSNLILTLTL